MQTRYFEVFCDNIEQNDVEGIAGILKSGGTVVIPTETVYGLAANALDGDAVSKIFKAKGRPQDNPLIAHICNTDMLDCLVCEVPDTAKALAQAFWPGPLTMVMKKSDRVPDEVTAGLETVAVRMPSNPVAAAIINECGVPLAAPSANLSGSPSPTTSRHVIDDMDGRVDGIVISDDCEVGVESTVILLADGKKRLLRPGGITVEQIESVIGKIDIDDAVLSAKLTDNASSPGMKYKHYAPKTKVVMVDADSDKFVSFVNSTKCERSAAICFDEDIDRIKIPYISYGSVKSGLSQAHGIFTALRDADELGADVIYAHCPDKSGVSLAVYNRMLRAAAFEVIQL